MSENSFDSLSFEEALNQLEEVVKQMEEGSLTLDKALAAFEKGIALSRYCSNKLNEAEKKIDMLLCIDNGETVIKPADLTGDTDE